MPYVRTTHDEYNIEQYIGQQYGWEVATCEESRGEARRRAQEYRANQPQYPVRIVKKRVKNTEE